MIEVAAARWRETDTDAAILSAMATKLSPGFQVVAIQCFRCYEGHESYCVTLWRAKQVTEASTTIQIRTLLYEKNEDGTFVLKQMERLG